MGKPRRVWQLGFTVTQRARYRVDRVEVISKGYDGPYCGPLAKMVLNAAKLDGQFSVPKISPGRVIKVGYGLVEPRVGCEFRQEVVKDWDEFVAMGRRRELILSRIDDYTPKGRVIGKKGKGS
jgi:hypothetical protein